MTRSANTPNEMTSEPSRLSAGGTNERTIGSVEKSRRSAAWFIPFLHRGGTVVSAGLITCGLFLGMQALIDTDAPEIEAMETRELVAITPQRDDPPDTFNDYADLVLTKTAATPPPPPELASPNTDQGLPIVHISGAPATLPEFGRVGSIVPPSPLISARGIEPLSPPVPSYPDREARAGREGDCDVLFNVDRSGTPFDVRAICTHSGFERAAVRAVERVQFAPRIVRGQAVEQHGAVYPIQFRLNN